MRLLVLLMMSVLMAAGMFAVALGVVYLIFNPKQNFGARGQNEKPAAKPQAKLAGTGADEEDER